MKIYIDINAAQFSEQDEVTVRVYNTGNHDQIISTQEDAKDVIEEPEPKDTIIKGVDPDLMESY